MLLASERSPTIANTATKIALKSIRHHYDGIYERVGNIQHKVLHLILDQNYHETGIVNAVELPELRRLDESKAKE